MGPFGDLIAAIAATVIALIALLIVGGRLHRDRGLRGDFVVYFGAGAIAAMVCAAMNIVEALGGGAVAAAVGNATNVLAPIALWAGARRVNRRPAIGALSGAAVTLLMLAITFVVPLDSATLIKTALIAVFGILAAVELRRRPLGGLPGARTMSAALALFAAYNAARLVIAAAAGMHSTLWDTLASAQITSLVSAATIVVVSVGALVLGRRLLDDPEPGTRTHARRSFREDAVAQLTQHPLVAVRVGLPDLDLVRAAHGHARSDALLEQVTDAARTHLPGGTAAVVSRDTVGALVPELAEADWRELRRTLTEALRDDDIGDPEVRWARATITTPEELDAFFRPGAGRVRGETLAARRR